MLSHKQSKINSLSKEQQKILNEIFKQEIAPFNLLNCYASLNDSVDEPTNFLKNLSKIPKKETKKYTKEFGITIGSIIGGFSLLVIGITSNFLFYSFAGLILLALTMIHGTGKR